MIALNPHSLCVQAEPHYYDFIFGKGDEAVPEHIARHIEGCENCQERLNQLKVTLSRADGLDSKQRQADCAITTMLRLHFGYIGRPVTCRVVKPFLPTLLDPVLQVRTPTPITVHIDNCQECSKDLRAIRAMNLNRNQLGRLSRLLTETPAEDAVICSETQVAALAAGLLVFRAAGAKALKHLCLCPQCRQALYEYRESVRKDLLQEEEVEKEFPCENVSGTDIFDFCVPYGIDPAADQYAKFRESLGSHLRSCPACLAKIQQLHNTVYGIVERAESDVVTTYHLNESAAVQTAIQSDDHYAGFPIRVEVAASENPAIAEESASTISFLPAVRRRWALLNLRPLIVPVAIVAAAVFVAVTLFFTTPTAKAVTMEQIYKAIEKIRNVYIVSSEDGQTKPTQELWVSKTLNVYMTKTEKEIVLWDIDNGIRKTRSLGTGVIDTVPLTDATRAGIERKMSGSLGLMPFYDMSDIPHGAQWCRVRDNALETTIKGSEVYDLMWLSKGYDGSTQSWKWRVFVNFKTNVPHRIEWYQESTGDEGHNLSSVNVVEQLDESQMRAVLRQISF